MGWQWLWAICKVNSALVGAGAKFAEFDGFCLGQEVRLLGDRTVAAIKRCQQLQKAGTDWVGDTIFSLPPFHPIGEGEF